MKKTERGAWWGAAGLATILLLGFFGCTHVIDHQTPPHEEASAAVAPSGFLSDFPTEPPAGSSDGTAVADVETALESTLRVHEIHLAHRDGREALIIVLSRPPTHVHSFALANPNRVVVDLDGPLATTPTQNHPVAGSGVARVRVGTYEGRLRIVADMNGALPQPSSEQRGRVVVAVLGETPPGGVDQLVYRAPGIAPSSYAAPADTAPAVADAAAPAVAGAESAATEPSQDGASTVQLVDAAAVTTEPLPAAANEPELPDAAPAARDDLRIPDRATKDPVTYALPVQATTKSSRSERASVTTTHPVDGGTISATPPRGSHAYTGQRISLDFKDADIQNVLRILADVSGLNIITTEEVQGKLTMRLVDVPWDQAFDAILRAKNLDSVRDGNIIRVSTVEQLKKERDAQRAADEAQKQVEPLEVRYIKVNYAKADEKMIKKVQEVLTDRGSATWDERTNTVVVRDIATGLAAAEELLSHFDTQTPQILIESNIVEAQKSFVRDLGVQWGVNSKVGPSTGNSTGLNFPGTINGGGVLAGGKNSPQTSIPFIADFPAANVTQGAGAAYDLLLGSIDGSTTLDARLTALETDGKVKIISRPRVVTLNNLPATIESLRIVRVKLPSTGTVISTGAGGVAGSAQQATEQIKVGITLTVTPQVSSDGFVFLDVFAKSSTLAASTSPDSIPDEVSRQAESHVLIRDGETFVLGGVYQDTLDRSDRGIPYLRSVPVLGWVFKNHVDNDQRQELLVFVTPKTVIARGTDVATLPSAETLWQNRAHP